MQKYELLEVGQSNIQLTTNAPKIGAENTVAIYKLTENGSGGLDITDITPTTPVITSIASDVLKRHTFNAPDENCYLFTLFNGLPQFFRVGTPTLRVIGYYKTPNKTIAYQLLNFDGSVNKSGDLTDLGLGVYYMTPDDTGDYIFMADGTPPKPVHTPYVTDSVGFSGKIIFQKDQWMLLSVPKKNANISDLVAAIEDKYGIQGSDAFRVFSAYPATVSQGREMLDYKPGVTPDATKYNFSLVYEDGDANEIVGFWCKTENYTVNGDPDELIEYEWSA